MPKQYESAKFKKARKPREYKLTGERSQNLCTGCFGFGCDPMQRPPHVDERLRAGLCPACGKAPCTCKSTLERPLRKKQSECSSLINRGPYEPKEREDRNWI